MFINFWWVGMLKTSVHFFCSSAVFQIISHALIVKFADINSEIRRRRLSWYILRAKTSLALYGNQVNSPPPQTHKKLIIYIFLGVSCYCFLYYAFRYNNVEEPSNISYNKRHVQALSRSERHKRMKVTGSDACLVCLFWLNYTFTS